MPEFQSAAAENSTAAFERAEVCHDCQSARADLNTLVLTTHQPKMEVRQQELAAFVATNLPECLPTELAVEACLQIEADEAAAGFPDFRVDQLDTDELRTEVMAHLAVAQASSRNQMTTGQIDDGVPAKVPAEVGQESSDLARERQLSGERENLALHHQAQQRSAADHAELTAGKETKTDELEALQTRFNALRAEGVGTVEALRQVSLAAEHPETQQRFNQLLQRVALLQTALPGKPKVVNRLLNHSGLNLTATTVAGSFADFLTAVDADEALTSDDRKILRQIIQSDDEHLRTGSQVRETALTTIIDPETGQSVPRFTAENRAQVREGVYTFTETGHNVILELRQGGLHHRADVTGLDGVSIGIVTEMFSLAAMAHDAGADGFIKHVYGVDFERFIGQRLDPITLNGVQQKLTHLFRSGHDGEIFQPERQAALLALQMRLVSPDGQLLAWADNPNGFQQRAQVLGLHHDAVLAEFGQYTQLHHQSGTITPTALQNHLHQKFPDLVKPSAPVENRHVIRDEQAGAGVDNRDRS